MKLTSYTLFLLFFFSCFLSIMLSFGQSDTGFKNYFFQADSFKTAKVYEYEVRTNDTSCYNYRKLEKTGNDQLISVFYMWKNLDRQETYLYTYLPDKVIICEIYSAKHWNKDAPYKYHIQDNTVFEYSKLNEEFGYSYYQEMDDDQIMTCTHRYRLKEKGDTVLFGKKTNIVKASGIESWEHQISLYANPFRMSNPVQIIYAEGYGIIQKKVYYKSGTSVMRLCRILELEEFKRIRNKN